MKKRRESIFDVRPTEWLSPDEILRDASKGDPLAIDVLFEAIGPDGMAPGAGAKEWSQEIFGREGRRIAEMILARDHKGLGEYLQRQVLLYLDSVVRAVPRPAPALEPEDDADTGDGAMVRSGRGG